MYDAGRIIAGLLVLGATTTLPFWYQQTGGKPLAQPKLAANMPSKECVAPTEFMRASHMTLLDQWRTQVVREDKRDWVSPSGKKWQASLTKTCLSCHSNKTEFCDACHNSVGVKPVCYDCHLDGQRSQR